MKSSTVFKAQSSRAVPHLGLVGAAIAVALLVHWRMRATPGGGLESAAGHSIPESVEVTDSIHSRSSRGPLREINASSFLRDPAGYYSVFSSREIRSELVVYQRDFPDGSTARDLVSWKIEERDPSSGKGEWTVRNFGASGDVLDVHCRTHGDLFLAIDDQGAVRIERWAIPDPAGAWTVTLPIAQPSGPVSSPPHEVSVQGGGSWVPASARPAAPTPRFLHLRTVGQASEFHGLGVDPDGRYFFVIWSHGIERFPTVGQTAGMVVADGSSGFDFTSIDTLTPFESTVHGRVYYGEALLESDSRFDLALFDHDNNGAIDAVITVDRGERQDLGTVWSTASRYFNMK